MARATIPAGSTFGQTSEAAGVRDETRPDRSPCPNWTEVDILAEAGPQYLAGGALLAELARAGIERREEDGEIGKAQAEALRKAAVADEDHFLGETGTPASTLAGTAVKLACAWRAAWWLNHGNGAYGDATLSLIASAMSDVVLFREAEVERRRRLTDPMR